MKCEICSNAEAVEQCEKCGAAVCRDCGSKVQVEETVMYESDGSGYPGAWGFVCEDCQRKGDDCEST